VEIGDPRVDDVTVEHEPWHAVWSESGTWPGQDDLKQTLRDRIGAQFGERSYVAPSAAVVADTLSLGERSFISAGCLIRDHLRVGADCSLNPHVTTAGRVVIGDGVRIASHAALYGFNHVFDDVDTPIWMQGLVEEGIVIEDDVWIGTHVVVCDGVTVGAHSVVAAGAVVTRDVPPYSVVAGVPARIIRDRREPEGHRSPAHRGGGARRDVLSAFDARVGTQWSDVLVRHQVGHHPLDGYLDRVGASPTTRAHCDAIEIAAAFGEFAPIGSKAAWVDRLRDVQDPDTGLFLDPAEGCPDDPLAWRLGAEYHHYGVLSVGYALEVLGSAPRDPIHIVEALPSDALVERLDALPWAGLAWTAGAWIDFWGTAVYLNRRYHGSARGLDAMFGWLQTRRDPQSGMWGQPDDHWGWLMPVNGFYRLTRGTYAQFGVPLIDPEATIDTVLRHARDYDWFSYRERNACNVLDVVHPLWLCAQQTHHRGDEIRDQLARLLVTTIDRWTDGSGFAFGDADQPGLQGTEMWLSIVYLIADQLGESRGLSWRPRGVHRDDAPGSLAEPV
jgi:acetyltransferase-like isoleucine patch superfamily enzyme